MDTIGRSTIQPESVASLEQQDAAIVVPPEPELKQDVPDAALFPPTPSEGTTHRPTSPSTGGGNRSNSTAVDGLGMWRSWTRVFAKPESACLDLLDNCFDAALKKGFEGRVAMESHGQSSNTISIQNNSKVPNQNDYKMH